jgi:hypothetical protein
MRSLREALKSPDDDAKTVALEAMILSDTSGADAGSNLEAITDVTTEELKSEAIEANDDTQLGLRISAIDSLKSIDSLVEGGAVRSDDAETIEFLISRKVQWYWEQVLQNKTTVEAIQETTGGQYFETIQRRFLTQYNGAVELTIPTGYAFSNQPNLMQKLTAYRVQQERRLGNWSGTGAGKTLSAVLASRVIDAKVTLIVANNNTIETGWVRAIPEAFPDSAVYARKGAIPNHLSSDHSYIVLNFETFQQDDAASLVHRLVDDYVIDFIVLDEIQMVKQRDDTMSKRRQMVNSLICGAAEKNPNLHVLGMSATPVVNNLMEAKALLEMIRGDKFDDLKTHTSIPNAIAMHEKLILHGIRYRPEYKISVDEQFVEVAGDTETLSQIRDAKTPLQLDQILLPSKIEEMARNKWLKQGTLIYSYYVSGMIDQIEEAVRDNGFRVGRYTGEDKEGLEAFKVTTQAAILGICDQL